MTGDPEKLNVAHLVNTYLPQSQTFIWQYVRNFEKIKASVICRDTVNLEQFGISGLEILKLKRPKFSPGRFVDSWIWRFGEDPDYRVRQFVKRRGVQVLHAHFGWTGSRFAKLSRETGIPLVTTFYGADLSNADHLERRKAEYEELFQAGSLFLIEGPEMKEKLIRLGCPQQKVQIQHIAVDPVDYPCKTRGGSNSGKKKVLFVGRFVEKKGIQFLIEAVSKVSRSNALELRILGDGPLKNDLIELSKRLGVFNEILWLGMQTHGEVIRELNECDLFVHPSVKAENGDDEGGAPTVLLEAQACGVPILSTYHADIPYVTVPGGSAELVAERNSDELARALKDLLDQPERWKSMGAVGRANVERRFNIKKEACRLESRYFDLHSKVTSGN